jgi:cobalt-zinc-cadmium efflux system membrane fusion protein
MVQPAEARLLQAPFTLPATVEADTARTVKVLPPLAGRIVSLDKRLGDAVQRGDVLFRIDAPDLAQAQSDAQKAAAALDLARRNLARQRDLGTTEIAAVHDIEQAQSDFEQAASEDARARARLAQLGASPGHVLVVRSPIAGRVVDLTAAAGTYWNDATAPLMTVADLSSVFVSAHADEKDLGAVFVGQPAQLSFDAYPGQTFAGRVRYIGDTLDPDTRRVAVRMPVDNRDGRLKPGMFASATLRARAHTGVVVPLTAVVQSGFDARVFVEVAPWRFAPRVVKLGARVDAPDHGSGGGSGAGPAAIEIVAGLKPGERVVVRDAILLQ